MLTLDLKKSNNHDTVQGKLILNISTNINAPIRNGTNTLVSSSATNSTATITRNPSNPAIDASLPPPHSAPNPATIVETVAENRNNNLPEGLVQFF